MKRRAVWALIAWLGFAGFPTGIVADPTTATGALKNTLRWTTASELENFGFDVYRGPSREGPWTRISPRPIRGAGTSDTLHRYTFVDTAIEPQRAYWYWIESISFGNSRKRYSPLIFAPPKERPAVSRRRDDPAGL